jgi:hypothetical protein
VDPNNQYQTQPDTDSQPALDAQGLQQQPPQDYQQAQQQHEVNPEMYYSSDANQTQQQPSPPPISPTGSQSIPTNDPTNADNLTLQQTNLNSTQNTLQIAEIRDGIVILHDGSFRVVVMAQSINFDLMSPQEKEAVEFAYQSMLNSLYFDIQVFIRSQKVDLKPYITKLDKLRSEHDNMLLALLMEDYIGYVSELAYETNVMEKHFYVVIPYYPHASIQKTVEQGKSFFSGLADMFNKQEHKVVIGEVELAEAKDELRNRIQTVLNGLQQCGVSAIPLDTQELIELYYDTYNPDTATRQRLAPFNELSAPIVTKGEGMAAQPNLDRDLY